MDMKGLKVFAASGWGVALIAIAVVIALIIIFVVRLDDVKIKLASVVSGDADVNADADMNADMDAGSGVSADEVGNNINTVQQPTETPLSDTTLTTTLSASTPQYPANEQLTDEELKANLELEAKLKAEKDAADAESARLDAEAKKAEEIARIAKTEEARKIAARKAEEARKARERKAVCDARFNKFMRFPNTTISGYNAWMPLTKYNYERCDCANQCLNNEKCVGFEFREKKGSNRVGACRQILYMGKDGKMDGIAFKKDTNRDVFLYNVKKGKDSRKSKISAKAEVNKPKQYLAVSNITNPCIEYDALGQPHTCKSCRKECEKNDKCKAVVYIPKKDALGTWWPSDTGKCYYLDNKQVSQLTYKNKPTNYHPNRIRTDL